MLAVLAERLRRTLKARVRKSVGSIPTDCKLFFLFCLAPQVDRKATRKPWAVDIRV